MTINSNYNVYSLYNTMFQGNSALHSFKLNRSLYPSNKAQGMGSLGAETAGYVSNIKSASKNLGTALKDLSGPAFSNKTVASSNSDVMMVKYNGNMANSVSPMTVKVKQTATGQKNEGARMDAEAKYEGSNGTNQFSIQTGGKTTQLSINVANSDTNKDVQQKMADAINKAGIDVKATVETDKETNVSILKLESTKTGTDPKNGFTVKDVSGDLTARTGANDVASTGQDAVYSVNGGADRVSQTNDVYLGNGVNATLKKASDQDVTVSKSKDMDYAKSKIGDMVKTYNDLFSAAAQRQNDPKAQNLASKMLGTSKTYSSSLSSIGVGFDKDGKMTIDSKKLNEAAENGKLEQFFTENSGRNYGFTNQLGRLADNVSRNTSNYVSSNLFGSNLSENFGYSGFGNLIQYNYLGAGSIFDYSF